MKHFFKYSTITTVIFATVFGLAGPVIVLAAGPAPINLSTAGDFAILSKSGISTTGTTIVTGDIGVSPAAATSITGFGLTLPTKSTFATSPIIHGKIYAPGYENPTSTSLTTAILDMQTAYTDGAGRVNPTATELGAGTIDGLTLAPGFYKWGTNLQITNDITLAGSATDVWIFVVAKNLTVNSATKLILSGGAQANNVFWVVGGKTTLGTTAVFSGNILDQTAIVFNTGARLNGRALAQTAVTLDANLITKSTTMHADNSATAIQNDTTGSTDAISNPYTTPTVHYNFGINTLRLWSNGESVKELQRFLNSKLNLGLSVDGKLGPKTIITIKKWQRDHNLTADGFVGVKTKAQMNIEAGNN